MGDKSVKTLGSKIRFSNASNSFPPFPQNNADFFISLTAQTTVPTHHWIGGPGISEN